MLQKENFKKFFEVFIIIIMLGISFFVGISINIDKDCSPIIAECNKAITEQYEQCYGELIYKEKNINYSYYGDNINEISDN